MTRPIDEALENVYVNRMFFGGCHGFLTDAIKKNIMRIFCCYKLGLRKHRPWQGCARCQCEACWEEDVEA